MNARNLSIIAIVLWVVTIVVAGVFFIRGQVQPSSDGRQSIVLTETERNLVLAEMRGLLASVQGAVEGLAGNDMKRVAQAARPSGSAAAQQVPPGLMAKLPLQFKQMGMTAHQGFDELVIGAESGEPADMLLTRLGSQMKNCVACHASFRLDAEVKATAK